MDTALKLEAEVSKSLSNLRYKILVPQAEDDSGIVENLINKKGWISFNDLCDANGSQEISPRKTSSSEIMQIFFTSGTTGDPKMVPHTQASYGYCHWVTGKYWLDLTPDDLHWNLSDTGWAKSAWSNVFAPWSQGAGVFVHGMSRFQPIRVLNILNNFPVTTMCAPPTLYRSLVQERQLIKCNFNLRNCLSAGEPLNEEVILTWEAATGILINEGYGQTETTLLAGTFKGTEYYCN